MIKTPRRQQIAGRVVTSGADHELDRQQLERSLATDPAAASAFTPAYGALWVARRASAAVMWIGWRLAPRRLRVR